MGGHPYQYFVPYQEDAQRALDELREREFRAGRYDPAYRGEQHASIAAAIAASGESGTRSILDIDVIGDAPDYSVAGRLTPDELVALFGTDRPTHAQVEACREIFDPIERGQCVFFTVFRNGTPSEYYFAGYSYD